MLLAKGADPRAQDKNGYMPHHDAAAQGLMKTLTALLERNRSVVDEGVLEGVTALHMAASENNADVIKLLIGYGADLTKQSYIVSTLRPMLLCLGRCGIVQAMYTMLKVALPLQVQGTNSARVRLCLHFVEQCMFTIMETCLHVRSCSSSTWQ